MSARPPGTAALLGLISNATVDPKYPTPGTPAREQRCPTARASGRSSPTSSPSGRNPTVRKRTRSPAARAPVCDNRGRITCFVNQSRRSMCVSSAEKRSGRSVRVQISASSRRAASASSSLSAPLPSTRSDFFETRRTRPGWSSASPYAEQAHPSPRYRHPPCGPIVSAPPPPPAGARAVTFGRPRKGKIDHSFRSCWILPFSITHIDVMWLM